MLVQIQRIMEQRNMVLRQEGDAVQSVQRTEAAYIRNVRKLSTKTESTLTRELQSVVNDADALSKTVADISKVR